MINNTPINKPQTGQIWMADLPMHSPNSSVQAGRRPVVIVSNSKCNKNSPVISIVPCSSRLRKNPLPTHVTLKDIPGLPRESLVLCEQIISLDKTCLISYMGTIESQIIKEKILKAMQVQLAMTT